MYAQPHTALVLAASLLAAPCFSQTDGAIATTIEELLSHRDVGDDVRLAVMEHVIALPDFAERGDAAAVVAQYLGTLLAHGFDAAAIGYYDDLTDKAAFWREYAADGKNYYRTRAALGSSSIGDLSLDLAAGYLSAERPAEARALLSRGPVRVAAFRALDRGQASLLAEIAGPKLTESAIFDYALYGGPLDLAARDAARARSELPDLESWLWAARYGAPAIRSLAERYFRSAGYHDMAAFVAARDDSRYLDVLDGDESRAVRDAVERAYGAAVGKRADYFRGEMRRALGAARRGAGQRRASADAAQALPFTERPVPEEYRTARRDEPLPIGAAAPAEEPPRLPIDRRRVERLARDGDVWYVVYASSALDPMASISGGYWLARSIDDGASWEPALYLGLAKYFPYVVVGDSSVPIVADGRIRLEVVARELDTSSIEFPPTGLRFEPERRDILLELALADLTRDTDGDGLADIVERRLGTRVSRADSDGDEIPDDADGLPLMRRSAAGAEDGGLADAILAALAGTTVPELTAEPPLSGATIAIDGAWFIAGDPELFAAARVPIRLIVRPPEDWRSRGSGGRPFYPLTIDAFKSHDGMRVHVIWSAQWQGGELLLTRGADGYAVHEVSGWIS